MHARVVIALTLVAGLARAADPAAPDLDAIAQAVPSCDAARAHCFGIRLHIPTQDGGPIVTSAWIAEQVATANRHFVPLDIGFQLVAIDDRSSLHLRDRKERDVLARQIGGTVIDVFITGQLDDVDNEHAVVYGVTWRTKAERKYIIVSAEAKPRTLAHELGHFFGLPHSTYAISIMNKTARDEPPIEQRTFADVEIAAMKPVLARLLRGKVIADVKPVPATPGGT